MSTLIQKRRTHILERQRMVPLSAMSSFSARDKFPSHKCAVFLFRAICYSYSQVYFIKRKSPVVQSVFCSLPMLLSWNDLEVQVSMTPIAISFLLKLNMKMVNYRWPWELIYWWKFLGNWFIKTKSPFLGCESKGEVHVWFCGFRGI